MESFGGLLKQLLAERRLPIDGWARAVGIAQGFAGELLAGRCAPPLEVLERWMDVLALVGAQRERFQDLASIAHLPERAQPRFLLLLAEVARMRIRIAAWREGEDGESAAGEADVSAD